MFITVLVYFWILSLDWVCICPNVLQFFLLFFLCRIFLSIWNLCRSVWFLFLFEVSPIYMKIIIYIWMAFALNLYIAFGNISLLNSILLILLVGTFPSSSIFFSFFLKWFIVFIVEESLTSSDLWLGLLFLFIYFDWSFFWLKFQWVTY